MAENEKMSTFTGKKKNSPLKCQTAPTMHFNSKIYTADNFIYRLFTRKNRLSSNLVQVQWFLTDLCLLNLKEYEEFSMIYNFFCNQVNVKYYIWYLKFWPPAGTFMALGHIVNVMQNLILSFYFWNFFG